MEGERRRLGALVVDPGISPRLAADSEGVHLFGTILCLVASEDKVAALVAYFLCVHNSFSSSNCYLAQFQRGKIVDKLEGAAPCSFHSLDP